VRKLLLSDEDAERRTAFLADIEEHAALLATEQDVPADLVARIAEIEAAVVRGYAPYAGRVEPHRLFGREQRCHDQCRQMKRPSSKPTALNGTSSTA
jgi:hypothetical protein